MYDLVDRRVDQLGRFEQRTLMAMRRWVHAVTSAGIVSEEAHTGLGRAMRIINEGSEHDLPIGRPCQPIVSESEAVLVALWRLVAQGKHCVARDVAVHLVGFNRADALIVAIGAP